jgi:hypothetical protein
MGFIQFFWKRKYSLFKFEVLLAVTVFWDVMLCTLVEVYQPQKIVFFKYNFVDELYGT